MHRKVSKAELRKAELLAVILPAAERDELERRYGVNPALRSLVLGVLEIILGMLLYSGQATKFFGLGIVGWVVMHASPLTWLVLMVTFTGVARVTAYYVNHQPIGEPLVWIFLRLRQWRRGRERRRALVEKLGPERPDRAIFEEGSDLVILASRDKARWDEYATVKVEDSFYKIKHVEERPAGPWTDIAYLLEEHPEEEVIRGLVHTDARLPPQVRKSDAG